MKHCIYLYIILLCCCLPLTVQAQHELPTDTLRHHLEQRQPDIKQFGEYQLDMRQLNLLPVTVKATGFSKYGLATKDFGKLFRLDSSNVYGKGFAENFSQRILFPGAYGWNSPSYYSYSNYGYGFNGMPSYYDWEHTLSSNPDRLQGASFKLNNGMRVNVYGKYSADGRLLPGMNAMPWQKHDFRGAFEIKSANGSFGLKVEVSREANPLPY
jgi:hypothetical protein